MKNPNVNSILSCSNSNNDVNLIGKSNGEYSRARTSGSGVVAFLLLSLFSFAGTAYAVTSADYFVLDAGSLWMWRVTENAEVTDAVSTIADDTTSINGVDTTALEFSDGSKFFFSEDQDGFKIHRLIQPSAVPVGAGVFVDAKITLDPPVVFVGPIVDAGDTFTGSGTAEVELTGVGTGSVSYQALSTFVGIESVVVPAGEFTDTMRLDSSISLSGTLLGQPFAQVIGVEQWAGRSISFTKLIQDVDGANTTNDLVTSNLIVPPNALVSSILPTSRSVQTGTPATIFSTIINTGTETATQCRIAPVTFLPAEFFYQTTDPATNAVTGTPDTPVDIASNNGFQTFVLSLTPDMALDPTDVEFAFACTNSSFAVNIPGVNSLLLSASDTPVPDIVALAATPTGDGIVKLPGSFGANAFAVATVNVGSQDTITASIDTGTALPVTLSICESNPVTAECLSTPASSVTTLINAGATPTFSIFVMGNGTVPFDPAKHRIFVRFEDAGGVTRGSTSVAVQTL